jgi:hypothetical protein
MRRILAVSAAALVIAAFGSIDASGAHGKPKVDFLGRARAGANTAPVTHWCNTNGVTCTEPYQNWEDFSWFDRVSKQVNINEYIGHDEPSVLFYSNTPGSGNSPTYSVTLPTDPPLTPKQDGSGGTFNFQLRPAYWFGMAMCDDQSAPNPPYSGAAYPNVPCTADSDTNAFTSDNSSDPDYIGKHPGTAFMEMQFYPPGWTLWPTGNSCDATRWCAALNIDSLSEDMNTGAVNNADCLASAGLEPVNFAYLTKNGAATSPANPLNPDRFNLDPNKDFFMNSGDTLTLSMHDTAAGFQVTINDATTGTSGSMTASTANGFGSVVFDPSAATCSVQSNAFHPEYATSSPSTRVPWAAHSYNVAASDEIGHFQFCDKVNLDSVLSCAKGNGFDTNNINPEDDNYCLPVPGDPSTNGFIRVKGCLGIFGDSDLDFDGTSYDDHVWPGTTQNHTVDSILAPTPLRFTSPTFGDGSAYGQIAFEADLPRIEDFRPDAPFGGVLQNCQRFIANPSDPNPGQGCVNPPPQSRFYPLYTTTTIGGKCWFQQGGPYIPGTTNTFGGSSATEYGTKSNLLVGDYPAAPAGTVTTRYNNFRNILGSNPCA